MLGTRSNDAHKKESCDRRPRDSGILPVKPLLETSLKMHITNLRLHLQRVCIVGIQ